MVDPLTGSGSSGSSVPLSAPLIVRQIPAALVNEAANDKGAPFWWGGDFSGAKEISFTPNADGINDVWLPLGNAFDVLRFQLQVFDRWGELVHETNDPFEGWDGQANGKDAPDGVYVFRVNVVDAIDNEDHELTGHVTLLR